MKRSAAVAGYDAGLDWDVSSYASWREVLADKDGWPRGDGSEAFARGVRAALSDRAAGTVDTDAPGPSQENPAGLSGADLALIASGVAVVGFLAYLVWKSQQSPAALVQG